MKFDPIFSIYYTPYLTISLSFPLSKLLSCSFYLKWKTKGKKSFESTLRKTNVFWEISEKSFFLDLFRKTIWDHRNFNNTVGVHAWPVFWKTKNLFFWGLVFPFCSKKATSSSYSLISQRDGEGVPKMDMVVPKMDMVVPKVDMAVNKKGLIFFLLLRQGS